MIMKKVFLLTKLKLGLSNVHPPQQIHDLSGVNLISQIGFQVSFWQHRVELFLNILGQFIISQFGLKIDRI